MTSELPLPLDLTRLLIRANHILHAQGAVDAFGHISVRSSSNPAHYVMSAYMAPALVSSPSHLVTYAVADSEPVYPGAPKGYSERFIHSEMYKRYPGVHCVIHSHAPRVLPFAVAGVDGEVSKAERPRLRPVFHMAGFLGQGAPVWDIEKAYRQGDDPDLLVKASHLGESLASSFTSPSSASSGKDTPEHTVVLMRHHGFTTWGPDIQTAIYRTIYTMANAAAQLEAMTLNEASANASGAEVGDVAVSGKVAEATRRMNERTQDKAWPLLVREVEVNPLYRIEV